MQRFLFYGLIATAGIAGAQNIPRNAAMMGGGSQYEGQCTVEVVVDGAAEVEIRGANAVLRNLRGQSPQWRRFECTSPLPGSPVAFRFSGVDGRGRQELMRDPRNGGVAVVRIEDPDNGSERYTFRLNWGGPVPQDRGFNGPPPNRDFGRGPRPDYYRDRDDYFRGNDWRARFFERVRQDLDHATSGAFPFTGDRSRLMRTQMELDELQGKLARGFYDERELDDVIAALQNVLQVNRLGPQDRDVLSDDINRLRDFRVRHEEFGARDQEGQYHRDRAEQFRGNEGRARFFGRIREDLEHVSAGTFPFGRDQNRLQRTLAELEDLQQKLSQGFYDERGLDDVIGALQQLTQSNRLAGRDRDILADDLSRLRDFRVRHVEYGAR